MTRPYLAALFHRRRLIKFASVGIVGAGIDLTVSTLLLFTTEIAPEIVKIIGAECAIIVMFVINDRWTYREHRTSKLSEGVRRLIKSNLVRSGGITIQVVVVFLLIRLPVSLPVGSIDVWPVVTMAVAIACGAVLNYVGETLLTWRAVKDRSQSG